MERVTRQHLLGLTLLVAACAPTRIDPAEQEAWVYGAVLASHGHTITLSDHTFDFDFEADLWQLYPEENPDLRRFSVALEDLEAVGHEIGPLPKPLGTSSNFELVSDGEPPPGYRRDAEYLVYWFSRVGFDTRDDLAVTMFGDFWSGDLWYLERDMDGWHVADTYSAWIVD